MKKLNEILHITEDTNENPTRWALSFGKPEFQGGESCDISEEDAQKVMELLK